MPRNKLTQTILSQISDIWIADGSEVREKTYLASSIGELNQFLEGGLRVGEITEWGMPLGQGGREVLLSYLARHTARDRSSQWSLWICGYPELKVYPPAWQARGVSLERVCFSYAVNPVKDLKPVWLSRFFRLLIVDTEHSLSKEDYAFLVQRARENQQVIALIKPYFLSANYGNVWAKTRINCRRAVHSNTYELEMVKGSSPKRLKLQY